MTGFTPIAGLVGGALIGGSASLLWLASRRIAGVSGIVAGLLPPRGADALWRVLFVGGLVLGGFCMRALRPSSFGEEPASMAVTALAGILVGVGTRLGGGCTSGHGVCGLSRGSPRSAVATALFMATGILTAVLVHHAMGTLR